ncbi:tRNA lysidine(34) synthetase TilS [Sphingomonas hengshuiensis]|uniref:tRNA(Ile)-lysidine synthase n=1 Tax=Sphingomonas hengshuiensis TaxID=1609977 RepID=A0A7U4JAM8_9SPHN|nr:tRNA lysidine(34) synthetase TilS [Sphingomonas hengshuiensis]AJP73335.1 tRNA(Ile)-lysidine synthetase [Sphingomonas hengshuiensis]
MPHKSANELTPPADMVARFRRDLEAITGESPRPDKQLGVAVSGGPDSLALLLLAHAGYPGCVVAATVDHGLRAEAAEEAAVVSALCARLGIAHAVLAPTTALAGPGNLQDRARALRYRLLEAWARGGGDAAHAPWIAVAHQQDDLAETFLMRARRGAGVGGLAAMARARALGEDGPLLVRPLLGWRRDTLAAIVADAGLVAAEDPSNRHPRFDRSRVRALLSATGELPPHRLALAAANLRDAEEALAWVAEREWAARVRVDSEGAVRIDSAGLPYELRRRLAIRAIATLRGGERSGAGGGTGIDRLVAALDSGRSATLAGVAAAPMGAEWRFRMAPPRRSH